MRDALQKAVGSGLRTLGLRSAEVAVSGNSCGNIPSSLGLARHWGHVGMHAERVTPLPIHNAPKWLCLVILAGIGTYGSAGWNIEENLRAGGKVFPAEGALNLIGTC
ncbi:hypothetical protein BM1_02509 [Bipolaris maydis]|nr:hypothetical protein BM1_02509 [Bipolaris maydis]